MLYLTVVYALTLPAALLAGYAQSSSDLTAWLKLACMAAFAWHAGMLYAKRQIDAASSAALAVTIGLTWAAMVIIYLYKVVTMMPFTFSVAISSIEDSRRTILLTLGENGVLYVVLAAAAITALAAAAAWLVVREARKLAWRTPSGRTTMLASFGALFYLFSGDAKYVAEELLLFPRGRVEQFALHRPDYSHLRVASGESLFIVQLESVNANALFRRSADGKSFTRRIPLPGVETMLKEGGGVFYPFFYANTTQTHRAQEAILCGISGNTGQALSLEPERLIRHTCLPQHLASQGYATVFLYAYFDLEFFNFGNFHRQIGFAESAHGDALMAPDDPRHQWGYDDCAFYERAFDYLERRDLANRNRLFAYFEVGTNHWPYRDTRKHPEAHPFPKPTHPVEHYLNSVAEQDFCLLTFWKRFKQLGRDDVHIVVIPDHSVLIEGLTEDPHVLFQTWLAYVPPARRRNEFLSRTVLRPAPSQAQIYPTVLELLGAQRSPQSFAFSLYGHPQPPGYADCHLLSNAYSTLLRVSGSETVEWNVQRRELVGTGRSPEAMDFDTFHKRYYCR